MKNKIFLTTILLFCLHQIAFSQFVDIPRPTRYYPLDNMSPGDSIDYRNSGHIYGTVQITADRFFRPAGAMYIRPHSGITIPPLNDVYGDMTKGFTVSFWTYIPEPITKSEGIRPWTDEDNIYRYFSINHDTIPLFGFERIRDRAIINRHVFPGHYTRPKDWKLWLWDPTNFTLQTGWYHIVMTCEHSRSRLFIFKPNGEVTSNMHYFRFQNPTNLGPLTEFGSIANQSGIFLDDFKFFNKAFTRNEVMQLHGEDATPQGMYFINTALPENRLIHTSWSSYSPNTQIELYDFLEHRQSSFKWVIEPVVGQKNLYHIRMAYTELFLGPANNSTAASTIVQIRNASSDIDLLYREWIIEPVPGEIGYYYIRFSLNPTMYLHARNHSGSNSTPLELFPFVEVQAQSYKWKLNLIDTNYELKNTPLAENPRDPKIIVSDLNPFLQILPDKPNAPIPIFGIVNNRWARALDNRMLWYLVPSLDGSFYVASQSVTYTLGPENNDIQSTLVGTYVENFNANTSHVFRWVMDRSDNIFGSRYRIKLAVNPLVELTPREFSSRINTVIHAEGQNNSPNNIRAQRWMFFDTKWDANSSANGQIYHISPGVYKIQLAADTTRSITTQGNGFTPATRLVIDNIDRIQELSHYWYIDYERTDSGEPIRDGSYLIKLIGTDQYMHTVANSLNDATRLEIFTLNKDYISTYKFFITPEGGGTYNISMAGNRSQLFHTYFHRTDRGTPMEIFPFRDVIPNTFRWRLQKVDLNNDIENGRYGIQSNADLSMSIGVISTPLLITPSDRVVLRPTSGPHRISWNVEKDTDGTYMIYIIRSDQRLYIRPVNGATNSSTRLEVFHEQSVFHRYPFTYRWLVEGTGVPNVYRFRLVGPGEQHMHIFNNTPQLSAPLEIYPFWQPVGRSFEWLLSPAN